MPRGSLVKLESRNEDAERVKGRERLFKLPFPPLWCFIPCLSFEVYQFLEHGVAYRDDSTIGLESALRSNHIRKFLGQLHV